MKPLTNKYNLPEPIYQFLKQDFYDGSGDERTVSATALLKPVQELILTRKHDAEIETDAIDQIWKLFGTGVHLVLEGLRSEGVQPNQRLTTAVNGWKVTGKYDQIIGRHLYDYKVCSVWVLVFGGRTQDWKLQLSIYRWLYWKNGLGDLDEVATIIAICRDWSENQKAKSRDYPETPIVDVPIKCLSYDKTEKFIADKLELIEENLEKKAEGLPACTKDERWWNEKKKMYAKCERYCNAYQFCAQAKQENLINV